MADHMVPLDGALQTLEGRKPSPDGRSDGLGFDHASVMKGSTYQDNSTMIIIPLRDPFVHHKILQSWQNLIAPMNQKRGMLFVHGDEVGHAYDRMIENLLNDPELSKWKYVMTMESDNIQPPEAQIRLLETIKEGNFDGVSGIYWTKGQIQRPMAYGDPVRFNNTGVLDFEPRDVRDALARGHVMEVNGIAMGCSLYRMSLFREIPKPWFVTVADVIDGKAIGFTQDLYFCRKAKEAGKRFAVDFRVRVGHMDFSDGTVY